LSLEVELLALSEALIDQPLKDGRVDVREADTEFAFEG
jgi:hypothetical protein